VPTAWNLRTDRHISSRLVVNKASMKMQHARIQALIDTLRKAVESRHRG
jgi:ATP phosphoribosyltransferase